MKLFIPIMLTGLLNLGAAAPYEIEHVLVKRAADAAFTVYYPFREKDTYPFPESIVAEEDNDPDTPNKGWFVCKDNRIGNSLDAIQTDHFKCSIHIVVSNHPTEGELVYTIAHELVHVFLTVQGMPIEKHHLIMYCEGYDRVMAKKAGFAEWNTFIPAGVDDLCGWMKK